MDTGFRRSSRHESADTGRLPRERQQCCSPPACVGRYGLPGDMVSSLIIARLPFAVPDALRTMKRKHPDLKTFIQRSLSRYAISCAGLRRAIRTETDTCVISILDERSLPDRRFHMAALAALPAMPVTDSMDDVAAFIRAAKPKGYFVGGREND